MIVHRSNRTEALVARFASLVVEDPPGPFEKEVVVVQGQGMQRWLSMELADRLGIWAHPGFAFPLELIEGFITTVTGEPDDSGEAWQPETLMWAIAELLPALLDDPAFAPIRGYLANDHEGRKHIQLSEQLANTFNDYVTYRPEMIAAWEAAKPSTDEALEVADRWQPILWRALVSHVEGRHLAARARALMDALGRGGGPWPTLPRRVFVFGVSTLPPMLIAVLRAMSPHVEIHLFLLSPSQQYWADIATRREQESQLRLWEEEDQAALHFEEGHPLLASMGRLGRDLQGILEEAGYEEDGAELYPDPLDGASTMLATLQSDMLHLRLRGDDAAEAPAVKPRPEDRSIAVHACHSPMREVEVLRDELLACFEADATLEPRDVVVMTPDIDAYAPFIEAVFGADPAGGGGAGRTEGFIPYRIADRGSGANHEASVAFRCLLDFLEGRFEAVDGLDLLGWRCIGRRFGIGEEDLVVLRRWIEESGIRWAADAEHREACDQPKYRENTWQFGIDRMLLGYAMHERDDALFMGVLPLDGIEGADADLLGRFAEFFTFCAAQRQELVDARSPRAWQEVLGRILDGAIEDGDESADAKRAIRGALIEVADRAERAGFRGRLSLTSMREQLDRRLERVATPYGFLSGGVTFCELIPMRSIPFRVVVLMGMNDEAFPRIRRPHGFDLVARARRRGDRSAREDDRYLFLESLLSARERLIVTHVGQSVRDGSRIPPSVVIEELLDVLCESVQVDRAELVVAHRLQAFSPEYFEPGEDPRLFSHSALHCESARRLLEEREPAPGFIDRVLDPPAAEAGEPAGVVSIDDLVDFVRNPARQFLRERMRIYLAQVDEEPASREPFEVVQLDRWRLGQDLLDRRLEERGDGHALAEFRAMGALPLGAMGHVQFDAIAREVDPLFEQTHRLTEGETLESVEVDIEVAGMRIVGRLDDVGSEGLIEHGFRKLGRPAELATWVRHLCLHRVVSDGASSVSRLIGRPEKSGAVPMVSFGPVNEDEDHLAALVRLYQIGRTGAVPLFPESSRKYAQSWLKHDGDEAKARGDAADEYRNTFSITSDCQDEFIRLAFTDRNPWEEGEVAPLGLDAADVARRVVVPMLSHRKVDA